MKPALTLHPIILASVLGAVLISRFDHLDAHREVAVTSGLV